jgi:hypothetical protein
MAASKTSPKLWVAADVGDMESIHVAELDDGTQCWVESTETSYWLTTHFAGAVDGINVIAPAPQAASGRASAKWVIGGTLFAGGGPPPPSVLQPDLVYGIAGIQQTNEDGGDERGAVSFDPSRYVAAGRVIVFRAVLETVVGGDQSCHLELFNLTDGLSVTTLSTTATVATLVSSAPLVVPADLPNGPRLYTLRLSRTGGAPTDQVACKVAFLDVSYP